MAALQLPAGRPFRLATLARREANAASAPLINPSIPTTPPLPRIPVPQPAPLQSTLPPPPPESPKAINPSSAAPPPSIAQMPNPDPESLKTISAPERGKIPNEKESRKNLNGKQPNDEEEKRLITIAGKNIGAIMELGSGSKSKEKNSDEEKGRESMAEKTKPKRAVVNSNVQSINNSVVLNAACKQHSPGVYVNFARNR